MTKALAQVDQVRARLLSGEIPEVESETALRGGTDRDVVECVFVQVASTRYLYRTGTSREQLF